MAETNVSIQLRKLSPFHTQFEQMKPTVSLLVVQLGRIYDAHAALRRYTCYYFHLWLSSLGTQAILMEVHL